MAWNLVRRSIGNKVMLVLVLASVQTLALGMYLLTNSYNQRFEDRVYAMRVLAEAAHGVVENLHERVEAGEFSRERALEMLHQTLVQMRFNNGDYIYAYGYDGTVYSHPSERVMAMNILNLEEPGTGRMFIQDFTELVQTRGEGEIYYNWHRANDDEHILTKAAYLIDFAPWNMYVGSGLYVDDLESEFRASLFWALLMILGVVAAMTALAVWVSRDIGRGVRGVTDALARLTEGRTDIKIVGRERSDEIGQLANAADVFKQQLQRSRTLEAEREEAARRNTERLDTMQTMVGEMRRTMHAAFDEVGVMVNELQSTAECLSTGAQKSARQTEEAADTSQLIDEAVQTVASAAEEMSTSARSVADQMNQAHTASATAAREATEVRAVILKLNDAGAQITDVVQLIDSIAEQTNLLALNATIEAARAGDAGKGFAVVASEVKHLAKRTSQSTEQIRHQVQCMTESLSQSVKAVESITKTIQDVNTMAAGVTGAMEQQTAATDEIGQGASRAASGTSASHSNVTDLREEARVNAERADALKQLASGLSERSTALQGRLDRFLEDVMTA